MYVSMEELETPEELTHPGVGLGYYFHRRNIEIRFISQRVISLYSTVVLAFSRAECGSPSSRNRFIYIDGPALIPKNGVRLGYCF